MGNEERGEEVLNGKHELVRPQFLMTGWANCTRSRKGWLKGKKKKKKKLSARGSEKTINH